MTAKTYRLTPRDKVVLDALCRYRYLTSAQVHRRYFPEAKSDTPVIRSLRRLREHGLAEQVRVVVDGWPVYVPTVHGYRAAGQVPGVGVRLGDYLHTLAVADVGMQVEAGLAEGDVIFTDRTVKAAQKTATEDVPGLGQARRARREALADRAAGDVNATQQAVLALAGPWVEGLTGTHAPDLVVQHADGTLTCHEVELATKGKARLDEVMAAYRADRRVKKIVYYAGSDATAKAVQAAADRNGGSRIVTVDRYTPMHSTPHQPVQPVDPVAPVRVGLPLVRPVLPVRPAA
jgi:hypothetical protein